MAELAGELDEYELAYCGAVCKAGKGDKGLKPAVGVLGEGKAWVTGIMCSMGAVGSAKACKGAGRLGGAARGAW